MKVPQYRRTLGMPKAAPGQDLSAGANPGQVAMAAEASGALGGTIQTEGARWFGHLLGKERATKQAAAEYEFGTGVQQSVVNAQTYGVDSEYWKDEHGQTRGVTDQRSWIKSSLVSDLNKRAAAIRDPVVRSRFLTSGYKSVASAMPGIASHLRGKYSDYSESIWIRNQNAKVREIAAMPPGDVREEAIGQLALSIEYQGEIGSWGAVKTQRAVVTALSDIDYHQARTEFAVAAAGGKDGDLDPVLLVEEFLDDLRSGERYKNLDISAAARLETLGERRLSSLITTAHNAELKKDRDEEAKVNIEQEREYERLSAEIDIARAWQLENPGEVLPVDVPMVTVGDLLSMNKREISPAQRDILRRKIEGNDEVNNQRAVAEFNDRITNAYTDEDLRSLEKEVNRQYQAGIIGGLAHKGLTTNAKAMRGNTPRAKQIKSYKTSLRTVFGDRPGGITLEGSRSADNDIQLATALRQYDDMVGRGVRPAQAYYEVIDTHLAQTQQQTKVAESIVRTLPSSIQSALGITNIREFGAGNALNMSTLTLDNLGNARAAWQRYASGLLPKKVSAAEEVAGVDVTLAQLTPEEVRDLGLDIEARIGVRDLYAMESGLQYVGRIIQRHGALIELEPPPRERTETNPNTGEEQQTSESVEEEAAWRKFMRSIAEWSPVGNGEESAADRAANRGAGTR